MDSQQRPPRRTARNVSSARTRAARARNLAAEQDFLDDEDGTTRELPVLPIRNAVVLPHTVTPLYIDHDKTRRAVDAAISRGGAILAVTQRMETIENPGPNDLYTVGVEAVIEKTFDMPEGVLSVVLRTVRRVRVLHYTNSAAYLRAEVEPMIDVADDSPRALAQMRLAREHFEQVVKQGSRIGEEALLSVLNLTDVGALADAIAMSIDVPVQTRQSILEAMPGLDRLALVDKLMLKELEILEMESRIQQNVQQEMDRGQKEYYLREQIKVIQRELADHDPALRESLDLRDRVLAAGMTEEARTRALREIERLDTMPSMAPEYTVLRTYLDWLLALPWQQRTDDHHDLTETQRILDEHHFGLTKVKDRLIEFVAVRKLAPESRSPILCLAGPPGVGKTSLGRSIAESLGRKFVRVSLGGVRDEAEIRGHRRTYVGALPGRILQTMRQAGTTNPVFVLDEIDKLASDYRGDPASALLEVLDPEQNHAFSDHYLEVSYDLSRVIFILTANSLQPIPPALLDRMEVIELPGYTEEEKAQIARHFLIPKQIKDHGLSPSKIDLRDDAVHRVIRDYTHEAGVRNLEREIGSVMRKVARRVAEGKRSKSTVTAKNLTEYLGPQHSFAHEAEDHDQIGIAMGVAWTSAGGELTPIEIAALDGRGQIILTGQLGEVMRESAQAAISYARSRASELRLFPAFHEKYDIHIHLAMGAVKKDGPSAGVPIAMALISALTNRPVRHDVAMTGEITLRGRVMPIGGLKEKSLAAYRAGLRRFILPRKNLADLEELSPEVLAAIEFIPVETLDEVVSLALGPTTTPVVTTSHSEPHVAVIANSRSEAPDEVARAIEKPNTVTPPHDPVSGRIIAGVS